MPPVDQHAAGHSHPASQTPLADGGVPLPDGDAGSRREFLKVMGASAALAGLSGCYWPEEEVQPFAKRPPGRAPGVAVHYASGMELGGVAEGLLVKSVDGRPVKIEGNPEHPYNRGATSTFAQALLLEMYDPSRSRGLKRRESNQEVQPSWGDFTALAKTFGVRGGKRSGAGFRILSEASSSVSLAALRASVLSAMPEARWHEYEPLSFDNEREGLCELFGKPCRAQYHLDKADIIVCLDADILGLHPCAVKHTRDFAGRRRADDGTMNRLYVFESNLSITGAQADHRAAVRPSQIRVIAQCLSALDGGQAEPGGLPPAVRAALRDLLANKGRSVVVAGPRQPAAVHLLAGLMNRALGNAGATVAYTPEPERPSHAGDIAALAGAMEAGDVEMLLILGGNPVYTAPADLDFGAKLKKVKTAAHLSLFDDETSRACAWHLPRAHTLESWGDARSWDGTITLIQPLIEPLYSGKTPQEILAVVLGETAAGADLVRNCLPGGKDEKIWRKAVHDGFVAGSAWPQESPACLRSGPDKADSAPAPAADGLEAVFVPDYSVYDGRYANNAWLQEFPDPVTRLTWDNAVLVAPETAKKLGAAHGEMLKLDAAGRSLDVPVFVLAGIAAGALVLPLGYGRKQAGLVAEGAGFNTYLLRTLRALDSVPVTRAVATGAKYQLVSTQDHHQMSQVAQKAEAERIGDLIREAKLSEYRANPEFAKKKPEVAGDAALFSPHAYNEHRWGMAIDLSVCTGCGACALACQAENNVPVVGKDQVARGREMHWLRVDRYIKEQEAETQVRFQPVACQQCENAPCEQVCPVAATVHSSEGLNDMVYNRCVGTRYCSNNCPYKVRRFNWYNNHQNLSDVEKMAYNPDVTVRSRGVMEKCTYCVQRINQVRIDGKLENQPIPDGAIVPACAQACPAGAIVFGDLNDINSRVAKQHKAPRAYELLGELNVKPRTQYLAKVRNPNETQA